MYVYLFFVIFTYKKLKKLSSFLNKLLQSDTFIASNQETGKNDSEPCVFCKIAYSSNQSSVFVMNRAEWLE